MRYENLQHLPDASFRRLCGVSRPTFEAMVEVVEAGERAKTKSGRPPKLSIPDQILLTLSYWREYRTLFHLGAEVGLHESSVQRLICRIEERLVRSGRFALSPRGTGPGPDPSSMDVVLLDASESAVERPKKRAANGATTAARRSVTRTRPSSSSISPPA